MDKEELLRASRNGDLSEVKRLEVYVNPNTFDNYETTPLHLASEYGHLDIVRYLVEERKCGTERYNERKLTPLHLAAREGRLDVVKCLIGEGGCNPMCRGGNFWATPLHLACERGKVDVVKYLVEDADVETSSRDNYDVTPLHYAVRSERLLLVKLLVEKYECDPGVRNDEGKTPADWARRNGNTRIASYLSSIKETVSGEWEDGGIPYLYCVTVFQVVKTVSPPLQQTHTHLVMGDNR